MTEEPITERIPSFWLSVPSDFYWDMADACGEAFAASYLFGATIRDGRMFPRTQIAWERLAQSEGAQSVLGKHSLALAKPPPWERSMARKSDPHDHLRKEADRALR